jgi:hypothetical protein
MLWEVDVSGTTHFGTLNTTFILEYDTITAIWSFRFGQNEITEEAASCPPTAAPTNAPSARPTQPGETNAPSSAPSTRPTVEGETNAPSSSPTGPVSFRPSFEPTLTGEPLHPVEPPTKRLMCLNVSLYKNCFFGWGGAVLFFDDILFSPVSDQDMVLYALCPVESGVYSLSVKLPEGIVAPNGVNLQQEVNINTKSILFLVSNVLCTLDILDHCIKQHSYKWDF